jgi:type II secretory pathway pseudopilin PulG
MTPYYKKFNGGFTLIETIIYIALFSILIGGVGVSVYSIIESSGRNNMKALIQTEGDFLVAKINWSLSGARLVNEPAVGVVSQTLSVTKWDSSIGTVVITISGEDITIKRGSGPAIVLNNEDVNISDLSFVHEYEGGTNPENIKATFKLSARTANGQVIPPQTFATTNYLRK